MTQAPAMPRVVDFINYEHKIRSSQCAMLWYSTTSNNPYCRRVLLSPLHHWLHHGTSEHTWPKRSGGAGVDDFAMLDGIDSVDEVEGDY